MLARPGEVIFRGCALLAAVRVIAGLIWASMFDPPERKVQG